MDDLEHSQGWPIFFAHAVPVSHLSMWDSPRDVAVEPRVSVARKWQTSASLGTSLWNKGGDVHPSEQVLESFSTALHLNTAERSHLFRLARRQDPGISSPLKETITFTLEPLDPHPAYVLGRRWDLWTWNKEAELVFSFSDIALPTREILSGELLHILSCANTIKGIK